MIDSNKGPWEGWSGRKKYISCLGLFLLGFVVGALAVLANSRRERQGRADEAVIAIAAGVNHATWIRTGRTQEVLSASEDKMLIAARLAVQQYPSHPGIGYYLKKVESYCDNYSIPLSVEDRRILRSQPDLGPRFYDFE
jgi:hypothetical protein